MAISDRNLTVLIGAVLVVSVISVGLTAVRLIGGAPTVGAATGTTQVTVGSVVAISLPTNNINFGTMSPLESNQTDDNIPAPFLIQNDGTVRVNITVNATDLWSSVANPSEYYRVRVNDSSEGNCYLASDSQTTYMDMPDSLTPTSLVRRLNFPSNCDTVQVHVNVTVPADEGAGAKSSTVEFLAIQS